MLKTSKRCNVCRAVKDNKRLINRIYNSRFYMKTSGPSLLSIANEHTGQFTYQNLKNHVKKHQFINGEDYTKRHLNQISKEAEQRILQHRIESNDVFNEVMSIGMEKLQKGEMYVKTSDLIAAAKHKKEFELKAKDQQIAMMDMIFHFASGENNESDAYDKRFIEGKTATDYDPSSELTGDIESRENQSRAFYQSIVGDAATPGTD